MVVAISHYYDAAVANAALLTQQGTHSGRRTNELRWKIEEKEHSCAAVTVPTGPPVKAVLAKLLAKVAAALTVIVSMPPTPPPVNHNS